MSNANNKKKGDGVQGNSEVLKQLERELNAVEDENNALASELERMKVRITEMEKEKIEIAKILKETSLEKCEFK